MVAQCFAQALLAIENLALFFTIQNNDQIFRINCPIKKPCGWCNNGIIDSKKTKIKKTLVSTAIKINAVATIMVTQVIKIKTNQKILSSTAIRVVKIIITKPKMTIIATCLRFISLSTVMKLLCFSSRLDARDNRNKKCVLNQWWNYCFLEKVMMSTRPQKKFSSVTMMIFLRTLFSALIIKASWMSGLSAKVFISARSTPLNLVHLERAAN